MGDKLHLLHKVGPRMLLLLPFGVKLSAADVAVELQLPHAKPKHSAGFLKSIARIGRLLAASVE